MHRSFHVLFKKECRRLSHLFLLPLIPQPSCQQQLHMRSKNHCNIWRQRSNGKLLCDASLVVLFFLLRCRPPIRQSWPFLFFSFRCGSMSLWNVHDTARSLSTRKSRSPTVENEDDTIHNRFLLQYNHVKKRASARRKVNYLLLLLLKICFDLPVALLSHWLIRFEKPFLCFVTIKMFQPNVATACPFPVLDVFISRPPLRANFKAHC